MADVLSMRAHRARKRFAGLGADTARQLVDILEAPRTNDFGRFAACMQAGLRGDAARIALAELGYLGPLPNGPACERCAKPVGERRVRLRGRWWCSPLCCEQDLKLRGAGRGEGNGHG